MYKKIKRIIDVTMSGIGTGFFVGLTSRYILNHLNKINVTTKLFDDKG